MPLRPDFQSILATFVYNNLPVLMNPANAFRVVITSTAAPTTATSEVPVLVIDPGVLQALQAAALDNFASIGLPPDIGQIAKQFFANLPPLVNPSASTTVPVTAIETPTVIS